MNKSLQTKLNQYCLISRKYNLNNDKNFYLKKFRKIHSHYLNVAWENSLDKIQNKEIIKDAKLLPENAEKYIYKRLREFNYQTDDLFYYLNSSFNVKHYKLDDERIERRLRNNLALRHQKKIENEIIEINSKENKNLIFSILKNLTKALFIPIIVLCLIFYSTVRDGLTPVDVLTEKIYQNSVYEFNGSKCRDGTESKSQGRGTCSWHRGVKYKFYKGQHKKTKMECRKLAMEKSWMD